LSVFIAGVLFSLSLRQIDAIVPEFHRPLGQPASALGLFFWRCGWVDNLFNRLCGEFLSAQLPAGLADGRLHLESELDQAAYGFGAVQLLPFAPCVHLRSEVWRESNGADWIDAAGFFGPSSRFFVYGNRLLHIFGLQKKQAEGKRQLPPRL
jgi:hypothetical protein